MIKFTKSETSGNINIIGRQEVKSLQNNSKLKNSIFSLLSKKSKNNQDGFTIKNIENVKIDQGDKLTIIKSYDAFCQIIFILILIWTFLNILSITQSQIANFKEKAEVKAGIIERSITNVVGLVDNYSNYVGDKILLLKAKNDPKIIAGILKKSSNQNFAAKNIYSWLDIDYVNPEGKLTVSSIDGILPEGSNVSKLYPITQAVNEKGILKIGRIIHVVSALADYDIIPVALSIYDDKQLVGTLISRIIVNQIQQNIDNDLGNDKDISYVVLNANYDVIAKSADQANFVKNIGVIKNNSEIKEIFRQFGFNKKSAPLSHSIVIDKATYRYYQQSDYPFLILAGYSNHVIIKSFLRELFNSLFQSVGLASLFLITLYFFRRTKIVPVIRQLIDSRKKSEAASIAKSRFLSNMSHELRTPMSGIIAMSQEIREGKNLTYDQLDQANTIYRSADALLLILNDIVDFSKIESKRINLEKTDFDLRVIIEDVCDLMSKNANDKNLEIIIYIDNKIPQHLLGDPGKIRQILYNLIGNAVKFTNHGHVYVSATLENIEEQGFWINFTIEDTGIGIKATDINNLFSRFNQADISATRKFDGVGLGLAICEKLVKFMGGEINVESMIGKGSKFWLTIPLLKSSISDIKENSEKIAELKGQKFVVIDNSELGNKTLKTRLKEIFAIEAFSPIIYEWDKSAEDRMALSFNFLKDNKDCDAVLLGYMDEFDVTELVEMIKNDAELSAKPLILMTSTRNKVRIATEKLQLFKSIITKPIRNNNLIRSILIALGKIDDVKDAKIESAVKNTMDKSKFKILVVEDNSLNIKVIVTILKRMGITAVDVAENGQEGVNRFTNSKYDLIFMDCMMPVMDGYEATKKIRTMEKEQKIVKLVPIIALTADATQENKEACFNCGMNDFITKPTKKEVIEEIIAKWVSVS